MLEIVVEVYCLLYYASKQIIAIGRIRINTWFFCIALVGLDYFVELHLSFLLVGHTHEEIDHRLSVILGTLKCHNNDSMQKLLELIKKAVSHIEAFTTSRHLEYVWDWKKFITTHLYTSPNILVGISRKHYFKC